MPGHVPALQFRTPISYSVLPALKAARRGRRDVLLGGTDTTTAPGAIFLGKMAERPYDNIWLDTEGAHVVYVMGKRRSGKSYTLGVLAEGLVSNGWVRQDGGGQGVLILDTMNVYLTMPFLVHEAELGIRGRRSRATDEWELGREPVPVRLFRPRGSPVPPAVGTREFALKPSDLRPEEWCGMFGVDPLADPLGHLMMELHARVAIEGYHDRQRSTDVPPKSNYVLKDLLGALNLDASLERYHRDTREALRRRLVALARLPLFADNGLDVMDLLEPDAITVLLLRDLEQELRSVLIGYVVRQIFQGRSEVDAHERLLPMLEARAARLEGEDSGVREEARRLVVESRRLIAAGLPRSWLIIDEAHNYIPRTGSASSRKWLKKYVTEGRNLGLSIVVATQQPAGLDPAVQRNADVLLCHSLSHRDDIRAADGMINTAHPTEIVRGSGEARTGPRLFEGTLRQLPPGYALIAEDKMNRWIPAVVRPRITVHGGGSY